MHGVVQLAPKAAALVEVAGERPVAVLLVLAERRLDSILQRLGEALDLGLGLPGSHGLLQNAQGIWVVWLAELPLLLVDERLHPILRQQQAQHFQVRGHGGGDGGGGVGDSRFWFVDFRDLKQHAQRHLAADIAAAADPEEPGGAAKEAARDDDQRPEHQALQGAAIIGRSAARSWWRLVHGVRACPVGEMLID